MFPEVVSTAQTPHRRSSRRSWIGSPPKVEALADLREPDEGNYRRRRR